MTLKAYISPIKPEVLLWARESAGYTAEQVAAKLNLKSVSAETVEAWETGTEQRPSYAQLKKLASMYKRPIAVFYLPAPPDEEAVSEKCRSLPELYAKALPPEMRFLIRDAMVKQINLSELGGNSLPSNMSEFKKHSYTNNVRALAGHVRNLLGISLEEQFSWDGNFDLALKKWRTAIENMGVWVFKDAFKQEDYSGFCLNDDHFPIIYVNNSTSKQRQIFTLFHELGHIIKGNGGISFRRNIENELQGVYKREEVFCNKFSGELLVPSDSLKIKEDLNDETIQDLVRKYSVSRRVILIKCLEKKIIERPFYDQKIENWDEEDRKAREDLIAEKMAEKQKPKEERKKKGGSYYLTQRAYMGQKYLRLAFSQYYDQRIDEYQLANYLGVKVKSIPEMESHMLAGEKI